MEYPYEGHNKDYGNDDSGDQARFAQPPKVLGGSGINSKARFYPAWQRNHNLIYPLQQPLKAGLKPATSNDMRRLVFVVRPFKVVHPRLPGTRLKPRTTLICKRHSAPNHLRRG